MAERLRHTWRIAAGKWTEWATALAERGLHRWQRLDETVTELLDRQAEGLRNGDDRTAELLTAFPDAAQDVQELMNLAVELSRLFTPVAPRASFRAQLYEDLLRASRQRQTLQPVAPMERPLLSRRWVLGAAALGSAVSVVGVLAYWLRVRHHGRAGQITST